jgi:hypothetical protein
MHKVGPAGGLKKTSQGMIPDHFALHYRKFDNCPFRK